MDHLGRAWSIVDRLGAMRYLPPIPYPEAGQTPTEWALANGLVYWVADKNYRLTEKGVTFLMVAGFSKEAAEGFTFVDSSQPKPVGE